MNAVQKQILAWIIMVLIVVLGTFVWHWSVPAPFHTTNQIAVFLFYLAMIAIVSWAINHV